MLTDSGSVLSIGPDTDQTLGRWLEYSSIKLRTDGLSEEEQEKRIRERRSAEQGVGFVDAIER